MFQLTFKRIDHTAIFYRTTEKNPNLFRLIFQKMTSTNAAKTTLRAAFSAEKHLDSDAEKRKQDYFSKHVQDKIIHLDQEAEKLKNARNVLKNFPTTGKIVYHHQAINQSIVDKQKPKIVKAVNDALKSTVSCLENEPDNGNCHKWKAILLLNQDLDQEDVDFDQVSEDVKYHLEKSAEINPNDDKVLTYLGLWYKDAYYSQKDLKKGQTEPDFKYLDQAIKYFEMVREMERASRKFYFDPINYLNAINLAAVLRTSQHIRRRDVDVT